MKKFKQKEYTIQEGHYTGPKDMEKIPGLFEVVGKSTFGGAAVGGAIGGVLDKVGVEGASIGEGISTGGKTGFIAGLIAKYLLNALHKPMKKVKFQEVDKLLRAQFGIYRVSGFTVGDSRQKRKSVEDKFGYNDRDVTAYKVSFCIRDNEVTMYTLGISDEDLEKLNKSLDYYCKKFSGMEYTAKPINIKSNSYSVTITFTNYKAIADFIAEVSDELGHKINLMNDNALIDRASREEEQKEYSFTTSLNKYDRAILFVKSTAKALSTPVSGSRNLVCNLLTNLLRNTIKEMSERELAKYYPTARKNLTNTFLLDRLKGLGYIEGVHYTKGLEKTESNILVNRGILIITALQNSVADKILKDIMPEDARKEVKGKVNVWTTPINDRREFDILLSKIIGRGTKPNVFL